MQNAWATASKYRFLIKMTGYALLTGLSCWRFWDSPFVIVAVPAFLFELLALVFCVRLLFRPRDIRRDARVVAGVQGGFGLGQSTRSIDFQE